MSRILATLPKTSVVQAESPRQPQAHARTAGDHDADAEQKKNERPADAQDQFAGRSAAERLARNVAERLHHQQQQRHCDRQDEHDAENRCAFRRRLGRACQRGGGDVRGADRRLPPRKDRAKRRRVSTASGRPNRATRCHSAPRMAAAAIGTGVSQMRPWLADIASASAIAPLRAFAPMPPAMGRSSGVRSANADAGDRANACYQADTGRDLAGRKPRPALLPVASFAASRSDAMVASARPEMNAGGDDHQARRIHHLRQSRCRKFCVRTEVGNPAT